MHWIDPAYLPEIKGVVDRFLIDSHGDADGMLLKDQIEIHFPPQIAKAVVAAFKPGDPVKVRGLRPRGVDVIAAVSMQAGDESPIVDNGPDSESESESKPEEHKHAEVEGLVTRVLHGPKGEVRGVLLDNGAIVRMHPHTAASLHGGLAPGQKLVARGPSVTNALGTVVDAHEIGASLSALRPVESKKHDEHVERKSAKQAEKLEKRALAR
jgi:hypothetical protein